MAPSKAALERLKLDAEIRKLNAEALNAEASAERARFYWQAEPDRLRVYRFNDAVTIETVSHCTRFLNSRLADDPSGGVEIVFNSPGGSVTDGLELYDAILAHRAAGARIDTTAHGMAASMAGVLMQAGEVRRAGPNALLMIHEIASLNIGKLSQMKDSVKLSERLYERLLAILASRSKLAVDEIRERAERRDWWLDAAEALEFGFIDELLPTVTVVAPAQTGGRRG